jgi:hypothetical protein
MEAGNEDYVILSRPVRRDSRKNSSWLRRDATKC